MPDLKKNRRGKKEPVRKRPSCGTNVRHGRALTTNHMARLDTHSMAMDRNNIGKQNASDFSSRVAAVPFSSPMMINARPGDWTKGTKP